MLKAITIIKRKAGMSVEAFQHYWRTTHAEVVKPLPDIRRYVQSHALLGGYRKGELPHDGIAEIWVDDMAALRAMSNSPHYAHVVADEARFIDRASMVLLLVEDHVIKHGAIPADAVKNIEFVSHRPGMAIEDFQRYWREVHGPLATHITQIRRYVQSHVRLGAYKAGKPPKYDGCALTWFESVAAMRDSARSPAYARTRDDEANFLDTAGGHLPFIITREHVIVA